MDIDVIMNLINNCLFPIAMCVIMVMFVKYTMDKSNDSIKDLTESVSKLCNKIDILLDRDK